MRCACAVRGYEATLMVGLTTATWVSGVSAHSSQAVAASGMSIGCKGATNAAKAMSLAAFKLYQDPELRKAARAEIDAARGAKYKYKSLLGDRKPPLDYRDRGASAATAIPVRQG